MNNLINAYGLYFYNSIYIQHLAICKRSLTLQYTSSPCATHSDLITLQLLSERERETLLCVLYMMFSLYPWMSDEYMGVLHHSLCLEVCLTKLVGSPHGCRCDFSCGSSTSGDLRNEGWSSWGNWCDLLLTSGVMVNFMWVAYMGRIIHTHIYTHRYIRMNRYDYFYWNKYLD